MAFLSGYNRRKSITIDADTYIAGDLTDQPIVVNIDNGETDFWANAPTNGDEVRFTLADGTTLAKFQVESYNATSDDAWYHIKIPTLSASADTVIYMYYDADTPSDGEDKENVWDSNFKGVYHLNQDQAEGAYDDATSNNNDGSNVGSSNTTGKLDLARNFDGTNDYVNVPDAASLDITAALTIETWVKSDTVESAFMISKRVFGSDDAFQLATDSSNNPIMAIWVGDVYKPVTSSTALGTTANQHVVGVYDGTDLKIYLDGTEVGTIAQTGSIDSTVDPVRIGWGYSNDFAFDGILDEVTISDNGRSADWVIARYRSGLRAWLTIGAEEVPVAGNLDHGGIGRGIFRGRGI